MCDYYWRPWPPPGDFNVIDLVVTNEQLTINDFDHSKKWNGDPKLGLERFNNKVSVLHQADCHGNEWQTLWANMGSY